MRRKYLRSLHLQDAFLTGRIHQVRYHYRDLKQLESCIQITSYARGVEDVTLQVERFSLDCRIGIGIGFGFGFTTSFGWLVYLLWFWFYDSQVKTAL